MTFTQRKNRGRRSIVGVGTRVAWGRVAGPHNEIAIIAPDRRTLEEFFRQYLSGCGLKHEKRNVRKAIVTEARA